MLLVTASRRGLSAEWTISEVDYQPGGLSAEWTISEVDYQTSGLSAMWTIDIFVLTIYLPLDNLFMSPKKFSKFSVKRLLKYKSIRIILIDRSVKYKQMLLEAYTNSSLK